MVGPHEEHTKRVTFHHSADEAAYITISPEKSIDSIFTEIADTYSQCAEDLEVTLKCDGKESVSANKKFFDKMTTICGFSSTT